MPRALNEILSAAAVLGGVTAACAAIACTRPSPASAFPVVVPVTAASAAPSASASAHAVVEPKAGPTAAPEVTGGDSSDRCIEVDAENGATHVTLAGRVFVDPLFAHPTHGKTHPYILRLDVPRCAKGIEGDSVTEVALAPSSDVELKPLVGRHVRVAGDPFSAHTAWHARPVVLWTTTATAAP